MIYGSESAINLDLLQQRASSSTFGLEKRFQSEKKIGIFMTKLIFSWEITKKIARKKFEKNYFSVKKSQKKWKTHCKMSAKKYFGKTKNLD